MDTRQGSERKSALAREKLLETLRAGSDIGLLIICHEIRFAFSKPEAG